jgi:putative transposase
VGQHRSAQRHGGKVVSIEEAKLRHRPWEMAAYQIRWGRRMAYRLLRQGRLIVNHKRVQRLWREDGLERPTPLKRKRARPADGSLLRHRAEHPHQVWTMDFQFNATADGRRLKFLNVIDEHSHLCLAIRMDRRCKAKDVVTVLEELTTDNGPEFNCCVEAWRLRQGPPAELVRGQWVHHGLHRAWILMGEQLF